MGRGWITRGRDGKGSSSVFLCYSMLVGYQYSGSARTPKICTYPNNIPLGSIWECTVAVVRKLRLLVTGKLGVRSPRGGNGWQKWDTEYMGKYGVDRIRSGIKMSKTPKSVILFGYKECGLEYSTK